ncbi:50S ribosomal protein L17 [Flexistipes sinusarabici]|uniref:50S ribosomal protein L17 n=1 Tax=Flexistipes sinusarabici TaxID=2352 RepID=UPI0023521336|nr:50S ribosomal protein L17 [Flexistipes sinusarabici]
MRHRISGKKLGKSTPHRYAMLRNMAKSLVEHGRIETTVDRAKTLRQFVEPLITLGKKGDVSARRLALRRLPDKKAVHRIFDEISPKFKNRPGGYTRILKTGYREGDNANSAIIEFVEDIRTPGQPSEGEETAEKSE